MSQKRTELENTATAFVQKSGLSKLSFRTLADEVGVKSSSVHYYFPEKSDLAAAIIENYTAAMLSELNRIDKTHQSAVKKLEAFVKIFDQVAEQEMFCLCGMMAAEVDGLNDENRKALNRYFDQIETWLEAALSNAPLNMDLSAKNFARILLSGLEGALLIDRADQRRTRLKAQRALIRAVVN